ncbi:hypothetical protein BDN72DRAFT_849028 [Pluteus cervinus]|uniref:Uncharacterized protein n=1 Tax=Pluteus cervinus TaxID=181527 RepID=A0ACD3A8S7_9AGAR|nr:hypothetical protein BDN72DRAFT_849028 [Pluteus cervinus]
MKEGKCYWCGKSLPHSELKRCVRCLNVCYCSRECQKDAWVNGHKKSCTPHPDPGAGKNSIGWRELEIDKALTRWLDIWRPMLSHVALVALDLSNHPANRNETHLVIIWVVARPGMRSPSQNHRILKGEVWPVERCDVEWPQLELKAVKDFEDDRLRFMVVLEDQYGITIRARSVTTGTGVATIVRAMPKESSRNMAARWVEDLSKIIDGGDAKASKEYEGLML